MEWGITKRDHSAQKKPAGNARNWAAKHSLGVGAGDTLPRDKKVRKIEPAVVYPASVLTAARKGGVSVKSYLAMARLDNFLQHSKT